MYPAATVQANHPYYLAGEATESDLELPVVDKFTGEILTRVCRADRGAVLAAIGAAQGAEDAMRELPSYERSRILAHCTRRFEERASELAEVLCGEAGKPIRDARGEVGRLIDTFRIAAEEATRIGGEVLCLDVTPRARGYQGMTRRLPLGAVGLITPWNFPLNLVAHKVAPAIAAGCPFVLKPASATPCSALIVGEVLAECDLPPGSFSILPCEVADAEPLVRDDRLKLLSFTGSHEVGWKLKNAAGKKRVQLELGGNAACIVDAESDLRDVIDRLVIGAFYQSGQSCISVQRVLVHESIHSELVERWVAASEALEVGDPRREETFVGPLITEAEARRLEGWIEQARAAGARLYCGGRREGALLWPTLLGGVADSSPLWAEEAFGPVAVIEPFEDFDAALERVNDSKYGLQAGVFTRDLYHAQRAWERLEVGAVVIGDIPSWRVDHMPYGGVKDSGLGREGLRYSIEEMTEPRLMVIRRPPESQVSDGGAQ